MPFLPRRSSSCPATSTSCRPWARGGRALPPAASALRPTAGGAACSRAASCPRSSARWGPSGSAAAAAHALWRLSCCAARAGPCFLQGSRHPSSPPNAMHVHHAYLTLTNHPHCPLHPPRPVEPRVCGAAGPDPVGGLPPGPSQAATAGEGGWPHGCGSLLAHRTCKTQRRCSRHAPILALASRRLPAPQPTH
jgi:hypothetical protein